MSAPKHGAATVVSRLVDWRSSDAVVHGQRQEKEEDAGEEGADEGQRVAASRREATGDAQARGGDGGPARSQGVGR